MPAYRHRAVHRLATSLGTCRVKGERLYDGAWLDEVTTDADPIDGGHRSLLIRHHNTTGELAFCCCGNE